MIVPPYRDMLWSIKIGRRGILSRTRVFAKGGLPVRYEDDGGSDDAGVSVDSHWGSGSKAALRELEIKRILDNKLIGLRQPTSQAPQPTSSMSQ